MRLLYLPDQYSQQRQRSKKVYVYPVLMAMEAEYMRREGNEVDWEVGQGKYDRVITTLDNISFRSLPRPDRVFTKANDKKYQSYGNYKYHPATHIQAARDCWWAKCSFCEWAKKYPTYECREVKDVVSEIDECHALGFKEIFDDSGTFPVGNWLGRFCAAMACKTYKTSLGCNMRLVKADYEFMQWAGFRMVLFGIESANQKTLDRLSKGVNADDIIPILKKASKAGLEPHGAFMFGYPWESEEEEKRTLDLCHFLLKKGYLKTAQASLYKVPYENPLQRGNCQRIYDVAWSPEFWFHQIKGISSLGDIMYLIRKIKAGLNV